VPQLSGGREPGRYDGLVVTESTSTESTSTELANQSITKLLSAPTKADTPREDEVAALLLPIGHYVGTHYRIDQPGNSRQVRRGSTVHDLIDDQFALWTLAHGSQGAIENERAWQRQSVEEQAHAMALAGAGEHIDGLIEIGLLVEVTPGSDQALDFARSHRLVPLMLGLGNSSDDLDSFGIGFLHQPVLGVSHAIYDVWQWSTMDDSLWATCENAADVARRAGSTNPDFVDPTVMFTEFLGTLHGLLLPNAAYLDIGFRLNWPQRASAPAEGISRGWDR
jgi:hypothetical protein